MVGFKPGPLNSCRAATPPSCPLVVFLANFIFFAVFSEFFLLISLYDSLGFVWQQEGAGGGERAGNREGVSVISNTERELLRLQLCLFFAFYSSCGLSFGTIVWQCDVQVQNERLAANVAAIISRKGGRKRKQASKLPHSPRCRMSHPPQTSLHHTPHTPRLQVTDTVCSQKKRGRPTKQEMIVAQKAYGPNGVPPIVLKNCASVLTSCLVKLFHLCLSTSTFPSCWKYAYIQPVPKKGDRSNPSNYCPIALLSCLSKAFESILNWKKTLLSTSDLLSDRQYGFCKGRSTGDLLSLLTDSWSSSLSCFGETFSVALDISKAFNRIWHRSLISKLPSFGFYPSLCSFIFSFLSGRSISAVVDGHCSSPKPINNGVPQGSVLSPTLFLLFINDLSVTNGPIHSYADDSTLHFSTSFSLLDFLWQKTHPTRLQTGGGRTLNFRSCSHFRLVQKEPGILQCLKNSISSSISST